MSPEVQTENNAALQIDAEDEYQSVNREHIEAARAAGNTWFYKDVELEMFVAKGYIETVTEINNPATGESSGAVLIHKFSWDKENAFIARERAFKTSLSRVGRSAKQRVKTTQAVPTNAALYASLIQGGMIRQIENGKQKDDEKSREEMLEFVRLYPESASEAIETWLDAAKFKLVDDSSINNFDWIFQNHPVKKVLWYIGEENNPVAAGILTFRSPSAEERQRLDDEVQNIESEKKGDVNFAELSENFAKKLEYGAKLLTNIEGISVEREGNPYVADSNSQVKRRFITLFNPIWFVEAVETMHESFNFTKGK